MANIEPGDLFPQVVDELGDEWFLLLLENDDPAHNLPLGSNTLLNGVRSMTQIWQLLGITAADTMAWSTPGRLSLSVEICDHSPYFNPSDHRMIPGVILSAIRLDYLGPSIRAGWVYSDPFDDPEMSGSCESMVFPIEPAKPAKGIDEAIGWLLTQAQRPIHRLEWTSGGEPIARL